MDLGPAGPFPDAPLVSELDRRWLHYAFRSPDGAVTMIANLSRLGATSETERDERMSILLTHHAAHGWSSSQFTADAPDEPWSAFRARDVQFADGFAIRSATASVDLTLTRTGRPCVSQCAPFADDQHLRWQSEPGVLATGTVSGADWAVTDARLVGYHERVRGRWGWPQLGGWVFGFANSHSEGAHAAPRYSLVFTLIQPPAPADAANGSVMLWRDGRLIRHFPRRCLDVGVAGGLARDLVTLTPPFASLIGTAPAAEVPGRLVVVASMGDDRLVLEFASETAARIANPSELGSRPFSVHETLGPCQVRGRISGAEVRFDAPAVVEFAGGANVD